MRTLPLVSVGIPTYNRVTECHRAILSVLVQTYLNIELVISDNSDNNETAIVVKRIIKEKMHNIKINYIHQTNNIGATDNFKFVLQQANGKYFMWLEDEMELAPNFIEKAVKFLEINSDYTLVSSNFIYSRNEKEQKRYDIYSIENNYSILRSITAWKTHNTSIIYSLGRKEIFQRINLQKKFAEDRNILSILVYYGKLKVFEEIFNKRYLNFSLSSNGDIYKKMLNSVDVKYYNDFLAQMYVGIRAFKRTLNEHLYSRNILKRIFLGVVFMFSSWLYTVYTLNIEKKIIPLLYLIQYRKYYKYFYINKKYLNKNEHLFLIKELKLIASNYKKYAIFGMGVFGHLSLIIIKNKNYNMPSVIFDNFINDSFLSINIIKPTDENIKKYECIFITSISYEEVIKNQLTSLGYKGKIIMWKEMYEYRK